MNAWLALVIAALVLAAVGVAGLAIAACIAAGRADRLEEGRHYLTPQDLAPMTDAQRERLARQLLEDGPEGP